MNQAFFQQLLVTEDGVASWEYQEPFALPLAVHEHGDSTMTTEGDSQLWRVEDSTDLGDTQAKARGEPGIRRYERRKPEHLGGPGFNLSGASLNSWPSSKDVHLAEREGFRQWPSCSTKVLVDELRCAIWELRWELCVTKPMRVGCHAVARLVRQRPAVEQCDDIAPHLPHGSYGEAATGAAPTTDECLSPAQRMGTNPKDWCPRFAPLSPRNSWLSNSPSHRHEDGAYTVDVATRQTVRARRVVEVTDVTLRDLLADADDPTPDDVTITVDGRRIDTPDKLRAFVAEFERDHPAFARARADEQR